MDPPSAFRFPVPASQPLQSLSPERVNASRPKSTISDLDDSPTRKAKANLFADYNPTTPSKVSGFTLPQSPSLPEIHALRSHVRTNSDVQGLVKRFEHLDVRDKDAESAERRKRHEAELRRAQVGREEAESDAKRLREELRRLKKDGEEERDKEFRLARTVDVLMDELATAKEAHTSQASIYEKELRKARKEAFKSSSAVLKLQEELKSTRNTLRITQSGFDLERQKVQRKEQERFEMEYQLIPLQEQLEKLEHKLRVVEEEREALKTTLKEEEVARIAAEGMIALPVSQDMDIDLLSSPRKQASPGKPGFFFTLEENKENLGASPKKVLESRRMAEEVDREKRRREHAEELVDFLRMECMFQCCASTTASRMGHRIALQLDEELAAGIERIRAGMEEILTPPVESNEMRDEMDVEVPASSVKKEAVEEIVEIKAEPVDDEQPQLLADIPAIPTENEQEIDRSNTFGAEEEEGEQWLGVSAAQPLVHEPVQSSVMADIVPTSRLPEPETPTQPSSYETTPFRHNQPSIRTVTTTTTVPMHFTPISKPILAPVFDTEDAENIPPTPSTAAGLDEAPTIDRAAALAAIEYRRGRAKSIANGQATPRKQMLEGVGLGVRRDISAPALGQKSGGGGGGAFSVKSMGTGSLRGRR